MPEAYYIDNRGVKRVDIDSVYIYDPFPCSACNSETHRFDLTLEDYVHAGKCRQEIKEAQSLEWLKERIERLEASRGNDPHCLRPCCNSSETGAGSEWN